MSLSITDIPEVTAALRNELANLLRQQADAEASQAVARRLREIANTFETDAGPPGTVIVDANRQHDGSFAPHYPLSPHGRRPAP